MGSKIRKPVCVQKIIDRIDFFPMNNPMDTANLAEFFKRAQDKQYGFVPYFLDEGKTNYVQTLSAEYLLQSIRVIKSELLLKSTSLKEKEREEFIEGNGKFALKQAENVLEILRYNKEYPEYFVWETILKSQSLLLHLYSNEAEEENAVYDTKHGLRFLTIALARQHLENWFKLAYNWIEVSANTQINNPTEYWIRACKILDQVNNVLSLESEMEETEELLLKLLNSHKYTAYLNILQEELIRFAFTKLETILNELENPDFKHTLQDINFEALFKTDYGYELVYNLYNRAFNPKQILLQIQNEEKFVDSVIIPLLMYYRIYSRNVKPLLPESIIFRMIIKYEQHIITEISKVNPNLAKNIKEWLPNHFRNVVM
jgi:hypothetical protein